MGNHRKHEKHGKPWEIPGNPGKSREQTLYHTQMNQKRTRPFPVLKKINVLKNYVIADYDIDVNTNSLKFRTSPRKFSVAELRNEPPFDVSGLSPQHPFMAQPPW